MVEEPVHLEAAKNVRVQRLISSFSLRTLLSIANFSCQASPRPPWHDLGIRLPSKQIEEGLLILRVLEIDCLGGKGKNRSLELYLGNRTKEASFVEALKLMPSSTMSEPSEAIFRGSYLSTRFVDIIVVKADQFRVFVDGVEGWEGVGRCRKV